MAEPFDTTTHRYRVRGKDEYGDVTIILLDDEERARAMHDELAEDMVEMALEGPLGTAREH